MSAEDALSRSPAGGRRPPAALQMEGFKSRLESLYRTYNRREFVHPDPLEFLYAYPDPLDREIVGLIAASLAYGRVAQILASVAIVLERLGPEPRAVVTRASPRQLMALFPGFKHRFTTASDVGLLMVGVQRVIKQYGSLNACFLAGMSRRDQTVWPALDAFVEALGHTGRHLVPLPGKRSACKRLHLFLRWMIRHDAVDPGGWHGVPRRMLVAPLDVHMVALSRGLKLTGRKAAGMAMALEVTEAFRKIAPRDPVRYDFALTRFGIRRDLSIADAVAFLAGGGLRQSAPWGDTT